MATSKPLRAVAANEKLPVRSAKTVKQAASDGSHRELLVAMRDRIAESVEDPKCPPRDLASLSRRLMEIAKDIEALDAQGEEVAAGGPIADEDFDADAL